MSKRYMAQPIVATSESELQMHINNALRSSKKPVIITENSMSHPNRVNLNYQHSSLSPPVHTHKPTVTVNNAVYEDNNNNTVQLTSDANFEVIHKKTAEVLQQTQNVTLKYLRPPPLPAHGDLVIKQGDDVQLPAVAPLVTREAAEPPAAPRTMIIREEPPQRPPTLPAEEIVIPGKTMPAPPRQRIIERMAAAPAPPPSLLIERWLGYPEQTRRVKFVPGRKLAPLPAPKNIIVKWDAPAVQVRQQLNFAGVSVADPEQYRAKYGASLLMHRQLPPIVSQFAKNVPAGEVLGVNQVWRKPRLVGDLSALRLVNGGVSRQVERPALVVQSSPPSETVGYDYSSGAEEIEQYEHHADASYVDAAEEANFQFEEQMGSFVQPQPGHSDGFMISGAEY